MNTLKTNEELDIELGKANVWIPQELTSKLDYISGIEEFDNFKENTSVKPSINLTVRPNGLEISMIKLKGFKLLHAKIGLSNSFLKSIILEDKDQIFEKKEKSVIGRAIVGGILLGPLGAIIGGTSGIGEKEQKAKMPDLFLTIVFDNNGEEYFINFSLSYKRKNDVVFFFKRYYNNKFEII
jgi:hypothetical protein